jgi:hypothetical protein
VNVIKSMKYCEEMHLFGVLFVLSWSAAEGAVSYPMFLLVGESGAGGALRKVDIPSTAVSTVSDSGYSPLFIAISPANDFALFTSRNSVYKIDLASNRVSLFAGATSPGSTDGIGGAAQFYNPYDIKISNEGSFALVCDFGNHAIRKIVLSSSTVSRVAGTLSSGYAEGTGQSILLDTPTGLDISSDGRFAVFSEHAGNRIRKLDLTVNPYTSSFIAGSKTGASGFSDGVGAAALFYVPYQLVISPDMMFVFVSDYVNCALRKIVISTGTVTTLSKFPANQYPGGLAWGGWDTLYLVVSWRIWRVAISTGDMSFFAGAVGADDPNGLLPSFKNPAGIAIMKCSVVGYGVNTSSGMCSQCAANTYSVSGSCVVCPAKSSSVAGSTSCTIFICPAGNYYISRTIIQCASGTYFTGIDATVCTQCELGTFSTAIGATLKSTCMQCTKGTYATQTASVGCSKCGTGMYSSGLGASSVDMCLSCDSGSYSSAMGSDACILCPSNTFCPQSYMQPIICPGNSTSPTSSTSYLNCTCPAGTSGFVANATYGLCALCSVGLFCVGTGLVCGC